MRRISLLSLFITMIVTSHGQWWNSQQPGLPTLQNNFQPGFRWQSPLRIPFPQCLNSDAARNLLSPPTVNTIFRNHLQAENGKLKRERDRNAGLNNNGIMDFDAQQLRTDSLNGPLVARAATKASQEIITQIGCETNSTITEQLDAFLRQIPVPLEFCAFKPNPDCNGLTYYRTISGVCNNLQRPYEGSSQTAFARLLPAVYDNGINEPRSQSVLGGPLPPCRQISLTLGSKPIYDTSFNNLFVTYGQFIVHDITLATPVTDAGRTPITSCSCTFQDPDLCNVIPISPNDPFMAGQKCIALPATAQAFADQMCTLGIKDQMNGNSHYLDLSLTYGSTKETAAGLRVHHGGLLKSARKSWSKHEIPPGQRTGTSCVDPTDTNRCFASGDSRLMENILLSGLQAQWLRMHNMFAKELANIRPDWRNNDDVLYEETKKILSALHQRYAYNEWLPILIGDQAIERYIGGKTVFSRYDPIVPGVVFNEVATAGLRLHTLVRDLYSRCRPNGQMIDQVWLHDISAKCKLAYDGANNGVDSFLCGALYDFGFAGDTNFAQQIHHRLFEEVNNKGETIRHDLVSMNICRGREHGIAGYNAYRQFCGLRRANQFQDFADTMSAESIQRLQSIYQHPEDVDLFIGVNQEEHVQGGVVGPVTACLLGIQFKHLKYGDRFFFRHEGQFTPEQMNSLTKYPYSCFICHSTDINQVARNPFRPPNDQTNPLLTCSECPIFDFNPWRTAVAK